MIDECVVLWYVKKEKNKQTKKCSAWKKNNKYRYFAPHD